MQLRQNGGAVFVFDELWHSLLFQVARLPKWYHTPMSYF